MGIALADRDLPKMLRIVSQQWVALRGEQVND
jgi:hypothetical protein